MLQSPDDATPSVNRADWDKYEPALRRYVARRVPVFLVDDILQEVWLRLYSLRDRTAVRDMERYLFVVASNVLAQHHRRNPAHEELDTAALNTLKDELSPERRAASKEHLNNILAMLGRLPVRTRQIFILHRFEDMTYTRIANDLGISVSAVEKHMMKALKALQASEGAEQ